MQDLDLQAFNANESFCRYFYKQLGNSKANFATIFEIFNFITRARGSNIYLAVFFLYILIVITFIYNLWYYVFVFRFGFLCVCLAFVTLYKLLIFIGGFGNTLCPVKN